MDNCGLVVVVMWSRLGKRNSEALEEKRYGHSSWAWNEE